LQRDFPEIRAIDFKEKFIWRSKFFFGGFGEFQRVASENGRNRSLRRFVPV
jgi:hypothetical protein